MAQLGRELPFSCSNGPFVLTEPPFVAKSNEVYEHRQVRGSDMTEGLFGEILGHQNKEPEVVRASHAAGGARQ
jgi:hypothetical protein